MAITLTPELQDVANMQSQQNASQTPVPVIPASVPAPAVLQAPDQNDEDASIASLTAPRPQQGFVNRFRASADAIGVPPVVGGWAASLVSSAISALGTAATGLGDASTSPVKNGGSGIIEGITESLANRQNRLRQNQLDADNRADRTAANARADTALDLDKQRTQATLAAATINGLHTALIERNEDEEHQAKLMESAQTASKPFKEAGSVELGHDLTGQQITELLRDKKLDPSATLHFQSGTTPVIGADGAQIIKDGIPQTQPVFELLSNVPRVKLGKAQAADLNKYGDLSQPLTEGQEMDGEQYFLLHSRAQTNKAVMLNAQRVQQEIASSLSEKEARDAETRERNLTIQEKKANLQASADFSPFLAANAGDPVLALQQMSRDPKSVGKIASVEKLYGGAGSIERFRQNTLSDIEKTISDDQRELDRRAVPGATPLPDDELNDLKQEITAARAKRNLYLGLHPSDPPQFAEAVSAMDKVPSAQRQAFILGAKTVSPAAKVYLLKHYGLPIPPELQPQPSAAPVVK